MIGYALIACAATIWGFLNFSVKPLTKNMTLGMMGTITSFFGTALLGAVLLVQRFDFRLALNAKVVLPLLYIGVFEGLNVLVFCYALKYTTVARAQLAKYMAPTLLVFVFAPFLLHERISLSIGSAALLGLIGILCIPVKSEGEEPASYRHGRGIMLGLVAAFFIAYMIALERRAALSGVDPYFAVFVKLTVRGSVFAIFTLALKEQRIWPQKPKYWLWLLGCAVALALSFYCLFFGNGKLPAGSKAGVITYLDLVVSIVLAVIFLKESLSWRTILGGTLIIASGIWIVLS